MGFIYLRTLSLASCLIIGAVSVSFGQTSQSSTTNLGTDVFSSNGSSLSNLSVSSVNSQPSADQTGATLTNASAVSSLSGVNVQVSASDIQSPQSGGDRSASAVAGGSSFGASATAAAAGWGRAGAGSSWGTSASGGGKAKTMTQSRSSVGRSSGGAPKAAQANSAIAAIGGASASGLLANDSAKRAGVSGSPALSAKGAKLVEKASGSQAHLGGGDPDGASQSEAFPDSTKGTALLSPPDSQEPLFGLPEDRLSGVFRDLNSSEFLSLSLKGKVGSSSAKEKESLYQRFQERLEAARASASSSGMKTGMTTPSSRATHLEQGSGLKRSTAIKQTFGLPASPHLY